MNNLLQVENCCGVSLVFTGTFLGSRLLSLLPRSFLWYELGIELLALPFASESHDGTSCTFHMVPSVALDFISLTVVFSLMWAWYWTSTSSLCLWVPRWYVLHIPHGTFPGSRLYLSYCGLFFDVSLVLNFYLFPLHLSPTMVRLAHYTWYLPWL